MQRLISSAKSKEPFFRNDEKGSDNAALASLTTSTSRPDNQTLVPLIHDVNAVGAIIPYAPLSDIGFLTGYGPSFLSNGDVGPTVAGTNYAVLNDSPPAGNIAFTGANPQGIFSHSGFSWWAPDLQWFKTGQATFTLSQNGFVGESRSPGNTRIITIRTGSHSGPIVFTHNQINGPWTFPVEAGVTYYWTGSGDNPTMNFFSGVSVHRPQGALTLTFNTPRMFKAVALYFGYSNRINGTYSINTLEGRNLANITINEPVQNSHNTLIVLSRPIFSAGLVINFTSTDPTFYTVSFREIQIFAPKIS
jgi:hypothetical protein